MSKPHRIDEVLRIAILLRDRKTCVFCGAVRGQVRLFDGAPVRVKVTVDHVLPRSWGGKDYPSNLVCACERCNTMKATMDGETFAFMLKRHGLITTRRELTDRIEAATAQRIDLVKAARVYAAANKKK